MKIIYRTGNLLDAEEHYLVHGCNAQGKMGKGVAKAIRDKYPHAYEAYMIRHTSEGLKLGTTVWALGSPHTVINAITQDEYRRTYDDDKVRYADYDAIRACFRQINDTARFGKGINDRWLSRPLDAIALPLIGAGLAGGHWPTIAEIIEEETFEVQPVVYTLDGVIPT